MRTFGRLAAAVLAAATLLVGCGELTGAGPLALAVSVTPHAIAPGDTATVQLHITNTTPTIQQVQFYCQYPFLVISEQGDTVVGSGRRVLVCIPEAPPPRPLEPFDTLVQTYHWTGVGEVNQNGIILTGPLPPGLYRVGSRLGGLAWPVDTVRILP